jgi:hypothetical protein
MNQPVWNRRLNRPVIWSDWEDRDNGTKMRVGTDPDYNTIFEIAPLVVPPGLFAAVKADPRFANAVERGGIIENRKI